MEKSLANTPLSVLNLVNYPQGQSIEKAFANARDLARQTEHWGYKRYWMAEHHNLEGIASAATSVLIGYIAGATKTIRVGSGGIMLPNHSPLVIAEQFGTLATLYPGRIDLGLGRAPGTDPATMRAIRGSGGMRGQEFPELIEELESYLAPHEDGRKIRAIPGEGIDIPIWILGSSLFSAELAARLGRPYAFAGHFAPQLMKQAFEIYRYEFKPSVHLEKPHVMVGVPIVAAETDERAEFLATSRYQSILGLIRGKLRQMPPPVKSMEGIWTPAEEAAVKSMGSLSIIGGPKKVRKSLEELLEWTQADEFIITSETFDHQERLRSYELIMGAAREE